MKLYRIIHGSSGTELSSDNLSKCLLSLKGKSGAKSNAPCKYCDDYHQYTCPNHYHLYSTDEASSSEIDFAPAHGKGKAKKRKEVKKHRNAY